MSTDRSNGLRDRDYRLSVIIAADAVDDLKDALDDLCGAVEDAVLDAPLGVNSAPRQVVRERILTMSECQMHVRHYREAMANSGIAIRGIKWDLRCEQVDVPKEQEI